MSKTKEAPEGVRFSLFFEEEAVLGKTEQMTAKLGDVAEGVRDLADAYRKSYKEQQRLVRLSDRMQLDLQRANHKLEQQTRDLQALNAVLKEEVEHRKRLEEELRRLAETDMLTGAYSRRWLFDFADREVKRRQRTATPLSAIIMDLDRFKLLNDTYGHAAGDAALRNFVGVCRDTLRAVDAIGRLGGEEFGIVLPDTDLQGSAVLAERLRERVEQSPVLIDDLRVVTTVSIGVAEVADDENFEAALKRADSALYVAKSSGRNRVALAPQPPKPKRLAVREA